MDINTFNLLIETSISEMDQTMTDEQRAEVKDTLQSLGMIVPDGAEGITYDKIMSTLEFINTSKSSFMAANREGIENLFSGDYGKISSEDYMQIQNSFLLYLGAGDKEADYAFPAITNEFDQYGEKSREGEIIDDGALEIPESEYEDEYTEEEIEEVEEEPVNEEPAEEKPKRPEAGSREEARFLRLIYGLCKGIAEGTSAEELADAYEAVLERYGASYASCHEMSEEICREAVADGYIASEWEENSRDLVNYVKTSFTATHYDDAFVNEEERKKSLGSLRRAMVSLGGGGAVTYNNTDGDLEELAFTGIVYDDDSRKLRLVTSEVAFDNDLTPNKNGIFSESIFGALKGQTCECGECRDMTTDKDAKAEAICPNCLSPIVSSADRSENYALYESPIPLLSGRNGLIAAMLNDYEWNSDKGKANEYRRSAEWVVDAFEKCSSEVYFRYTPSDRRWAICVDNRTPKNEREDDEVRLYGPEGLEAALKELGKKRIRTKIGERDVVMPLALANALSKVRDTYKNLAEFNESDTPEETAMKSRALNRYNESVNYYSAVKAMLEDRKGTPADFLLHYLLIIPPAARPVNDRNGKTDYGEINKCYMQLISHMNLMKNLKESGRATQAEWHQLEEKFSVMYRKYINTVRDKITKKSGIWYSGLETTKSDECIRDVITPSDHIEGQKWLREHTDGKVDVPLMDLIGLPRNSARVMYKDEILEKLKKIGKETGIKYTKDEINRLFEVPAGTMEKDADGNLQRCLVDRLLDEVIINDNKGQLVLYSRQPIISNGSFQAGYVYLKDSKDISLAVTRAKPMNADYDGDTILVAKVTGEEGREELKQLMDRTVIHDATGKLMVGPQNEALYGLYKTSAPAETYTFNDRVIVNRDAMTAFYNQDFIQNGKAMINVPVIVNHVVEEITDAEIKKPVNRVIKAGEVYAVTKDGKELKAEESLILKESEGRTFAVTMLNDYVLVPKGSDITEKSILEPGDKAAKVYKVVEDPESIIAGLKNGLYSYNQPVTIEYEDGTEKETTPARLVIETIFGHELPFGDKGFNKSKWESLILQEFSEQGTEKGKDICSRLTHFGFSIIEDFGGCLKLEDFPSTASVSMEDVYRDDDEEVAHQAVFGHPDISLEGCSLAEGFKVNSSVYKGTKYAVDKDGRAMIAGYNMRIATDDDGNLCAYDMIYDSERFMAIFDLQDRIAAFEGSEDIYDIYRKEEYEQLLKNTYEKMEYEKSAYINRLRADRTESLYKENGRLVIRQISIYKNNYLYDSIQAGVKGESLAKGMVDIPYTVDRLGGVMNISGGGTATGLGAVERISNESTATINGDKTRDVANLGKIGNDAAGIMDNMLYEEGDCGTEEYMERELAEESLENTMKELNGRTVARDIVTGSGEVLAKRGDEFTPELVKDAYVKGVKSLKQRTAFGCRCAGTCEKCAGRIRGIKPGFGTSIGISAKNAYFEDLSQASMNRAKIEGGSQMEQASTTVKKLFAGALIEQYEQDPNDMTRMRKVSAYDLAERMTKAILDYISYEKLSPLYAELIAKAYVQVIDPETHLPLMLNDAINLGFKLKESEGLVNEKVGMLKDSEMSYIIKDDKFSKFGAFSYGEGRVTAVNHDTEFERNRKKKAEVAKTGKNPRD